MTRIAAADARMWADITRANRTAILDGISRFEAALTHLKGLVAADDYEGYRTYFERTAEARQGRSTRACRPFRRASRAETQGRPETLHDNSEQFAPVRVQFMHCAPRVRFDRPRTETE